MVNFESMGSPLWRAQADLSAALSGDRIKDPTTMIHVAEDFDPVSPGNPGDVQVAQGLLAVIVDRLQIPPYPSWSSDSLMPERVAFDALRFGLEVSSLSAEERQRRLSIWSEAYTILAEPKANKMPNLLSR